MNAETRGSVGREIDGELTVFHNDIEAQVVGGLITALVGGKRLGRDRGGPSWDDHLSAGIEKVKTDVLDVAVGGEAIIAEDNYAAAGGPIESKKRVLAIGTAIVPNNFSGRSA